MELLMMLLSSVAIGAVAQVKKGRTRGSLGGLELYRHDVLYLFLYPSGADMERNQRVAEFVQRTGGQFAAGMWLAIITGGALMLLIVATLPKKK